MNRYTIYCTEEQIKKAIELGAPIEVTERLAPLVNKKYITDLNNYTATIIPTAEQMLGWIEEHESIKEVSIYCDVTGLNWSFDGYKDNGSYAFASRDSYYSRKEATIAAIDAALDYLSNKK